MDTRTVLARPVALVGLLGLVLAGCTSAEAVLTVTFDGTNCSYDGPSEIGAGVATIEAVNDSEVYTEVGIARIDEGSALEDFVAFYQPEPEIVDSPDFATR